MNTRIKLTIFCILLNFPILEMVANQHQTISINDIEWRIGGKIHFEEEGGSNYIGIKEINRLVKNSIKKHFNIDDDTCAENAKIQLKTTVNGIQMTHFEEKSRPEVGEEMHATLLYTQSRGFYDSETLIQVYDNIFEPCDIGPTIESVALRYSSIIKPEWELEISEAVLTSGANGSSSFVMLTLLFDGQERLFHGGKPISAGLHMTLINFVDSILIPNETLRSVAKEINQALKGKKIKIAQKNGVADLEFGISGSSWRIRASE